MKHELYFGTILYFILRYTCYNPLFIYFAYENKYLTLKDKIIEMAGVEQTYNKKLLQFNI